MLQRRRFTTSQWLESEQISTIQQFNTWRENHKDDYTFSEAFISEVNVLLFESTGDLPKMTLVEIEDAVDVTEKQKQEELRNGFVELPMEQPKKNKKNQVNNPPKED
jgi:hypothetical protein